MMRKILLAVLTAAIVCTAYAASDYQMGQKTAEKVYTNSDAQQMMMSLGNPGAYVADEAAKASNKKQWWMGFFDRAEEIWLDRVDEINANAGAKVLTREQIKQVFDSARASYK